MKTLNDLELQGKRVLVRVDYNVPLADGQVQDDTRISASLPTLQRLLAAGASVILMSHLGRPKSGPEDKYRLAPVAGRLEALLGRPVRYVSSLPGSPETAQALEGLAPGEVALLENVRFEPGETKNDPELSRRLAALGDAFVLDAFGSAHRAHASVSGVAALLPHAGGLLMEKEVKALGRLLENPEQPYVVIIGGAKVSDKIKVIENLLPRVSKMLIGGGMAYTFIKAKGGSIGQSIHEDDQLDLARRLLSSFGGKIELPVDVIAADRFDPEANTQVLPADAIPDDWQGLDIGPATRERYAAALEGAKTVFWNGPMGVFEFEKFAGGTNAVAAALARLEGAYTVVGGGDSVSAINRSGQAERVSHISTGGGASLELLEGQQLPGVEALK
ncbi:phosphoglycerate kinase [Deinobacterium chartae]|uniref:Phosphoglycerate kinase n=1 Tax=Deinobacterium chartae TaxID=521158 RepID=A0A841HXM4_9DEIO|nr:phosphoglycerate kinase [Deinobacterium chartae]MBB6096702.1 phosphoglycerate kinase [Deinobacterium chartae]